ncbi:MAG: hypothetical protein PHP52_05230 [Bacteroidales bacterium]|jgi:hypothetical protein|nr:hypothetical protein [Bacteroidales bacterium]MDD4216272.1 hypothetical protein [Bacteroidales bacterium]MDY0142933.1 hypothetical protein [Bacteroidales bacterium]
MNKYLLIVVSFIIALALFTACTDENPEPNDVFFGYNYFPLKTGESMIYKVTEINIDKPSNVFDTSVYFIREIVDIPLIDNENDTAYRIERYYREFENEKWIIHSVWTSKTTSLTAEKTEENQRFVKIRFPVKQNYTWNGNLYNDLTKQDYWISSYNTSFLHENFSFDSCLTVMHDSSKSLIHLNRAYEVYAYNVGLIYKEQTYINSQEVIYEIPIEGRVTTGTIYIQELVEIE